MNSPHCCRRARPYRAQALMEWLLPGALLALLPKCPFCLVAYLSLGTGLAITPASASLILRAIAIICIGALALCLLKRIVKLRRPFVQPLLSTSNSLS